MFPEPNTSRYGALDQNGVKNTAATHAVASSVTTCSPRRSRAARAVTARRARVVAGGVPVRGGRAGRAAGRSQRPLTASISSASVRDITSGASAKRISWNRCGNRRICTTVPAAVTTRSPRGEPLALAVIASAASVRRKVGNHRGSP
ncbi:hypothetical protein [Cellulomonas iranensis]|uniref:hypothetical protein n=1 Tax=Cellulomonas iranensis TaxID=76862 RepID=UPI003D7E6101